MKVFTSQSGDIFQNLFCTCGNSTHNIAEIDFIHFLAARNNDCGRLRSRIKEKYVFCWLVINKPQPNLHLGDTSF